MSNTINDDDDVEIIIYGSTIIIEQKLFLKNLRLFIWRIRTVFLFNISYTYPSSKTVVLG